METITEIREWTGGPDNRGAAEIFDDAYSKQAGFQIVTTEQVVTLAIDDEGYCCETWGYFLTEDDTEKFIGAELREIKITDTNRSTKTFDDPKASWDDEGNVDLDAGEVLFIDIVTDRGPLQFVAYNSHNGYYGHTARVHSRQLKHSVTL